MKILKLIAILLIASFAARADLTAVTVPATMLHAPNAALGFTGKVTYTLAPLTNDSVFVTLSIIQSPPTNPPVALTLTSVTGDVGVVRINTNIANTTAQNFAIFFEAAAPQPGVQYVARIVANAVTSGMLTDLTTKLNALTKSQKATMCSGGGSGFESQGGGSTIPQIWMADGPNGVRLAYPPPPSTCFATCAGEACTWDTALAYIQGQAKGEEFRSQGKNCSLGPALNLVYHPQGGRASEYYSEDPYLSGHMAAADTRGLQSRGVMATLKHYACNNKEQNRQSGENAVMSERSMRELYLYNWKEPIVNAGALAIMGAYNKVMGSQACSNKYLMTDVLRTEYGFKYLVMSDWGAAIDPNGFQQAIQYGLDIQMSGGSYYSPSAVAGATDALVNMHAQRIAWAHEVIGDMLSGYNRTAYASTFLNHRTQAQQVGEGGIILARNTGNILPLPKTGVKIAVTGSFRNQCRVGTGGSSQLAPRDKVTPIQGMQTVLGTGAGASTIQDNNIAGADYIVVFVGVTGESEGQDRPNLAVQSGDGESDAIAALAAKPNNTIVVFTGGSAASAGNWSKAPGVVIALYPGQEQGTCIANVLFGNTNPSGKLPVTFPQDASQLPNFTLSGNDLNYPASDVAHGYFRVNKNNQTPLFAFGHGLSYTTFSYSNLQVFPATISAGDMVRVRLTVTNTGAVAGKEVCELYLSKPTSATLPNRVQDLRGFKKVSLAAGANTQVDFTLTQEEMQVFNPNGADYNGTGTWQVLAGTYGVRVGTSSQRDLQPTVSGSFVVQ